jgi:hypothetical protein
MTDKTMSSFLDSSGEIEKHRHNLPHWQQNDTWIFATWRLADSLPQSKLDQWKEERSIWLGHHPQPWDEKTEAAYHKRFSSRIDEWLDAGSGSCLLRQPQNSLIVGNSLQHFDGERYCLASYVVMPNHVHVLFSPLPDHSLPEIIHSWKRHTARLINLRESRDGPFWQADYWDRLIRSQKHFDWVIGYISKNPSKLAPGNFLLGPS